MEKMKFDQMLSFLSLLEMIGYMEATSLGCNL